MLCFILLSPHHSFLLLIYVKHSYIFFIGKVSASNDLIIPVDPINHLTIFWPTLQQLKDIIAHMKPTRSPGDVIPSSLFKNVFDTIGSILSIFNNSLSSGVVPASFKHAVIQPLLKKNSLDPFNMSSFRPISKLSFISKVLEKKRVGAVKLFFWRGIIFSIGSRLVSELAIVQRLLFWVSPITSSEALTLGVVLFYSC